VEFIVDKDKNFYFLEMNTRLQVEHPVTELITGLDLVEQMIRVAAGEKLGFSQRDIKLNGWAIEARVYAEDPSRNFLPSIGRLTRYRAPEAASDDAIVRVDTGVYEGGNISMYYDPLIAKLATWGHDRVHATQAMRDALDGFYIRGVSHNIPFLADVMAHKRFAAGAITTNFIAEEYPDGFHPADAVHDEPEFLTAVAVIMHYAFQRRAATISGQLPGHGRTVSHEWTVVTGGEYHAVHVTPVDGGYDVRLGDCHIAVRTAWELGIPLFEGEINGQHVCMQVERVDVAYRITHSGVQADVLVLSPHIAELNKLMPVKQPPDTSKLLLSPMPGLLVSVAVSEGQGVKSGEELAVIEAMKMENVIRAEKDCVVSVIRVEPGDSLAVDQIIMEFN
jgi:propionyl-CoA carboxylase alpha chain